MKQFYHHYSINYTVSGERINEHPWEFYSPWLYEFSRTHFQTEQFPEPYAGWTFIHKEDIYHNGDNIEFLGTIRRLLPEADQPWAKAAKEVDEILKKYLFGTHVRNIIRGEIARNEETRVYETLDASIVVEYHGIVECETFGNILIAK